MTETIDRLSGETLPAIETFTWTELGAFSGQNFQRNIMAGDGAEIQRWRDSHKNTGIFRSVLLGNTPQLLELYDEPDTLLYGDLCFDFDIAKDQTLSSAWTAMIKEIETQLVPKLKQDFALRESDIRFWFSGGRGLHIEVPAASIGVWPHHDLNRIMGFYAREITKELGLNYLDPSLYGGKHLYRLEGSRHQRTGLYKIPLKFAELGAVRDDFRWMELFAKEPRQETASQLFTVPENASKALNFYATLVRAALDFKRPTLAATQARTRQSYDRTQFKCVETMMGDGYLLPEGTRNTMALYFARHLRDSGFTFDDAYAEMELWATEHCDPPMTSKAEMLEWQRVLEREFESTKIAGCTFIQSNVPSLCNEAACPIGQRRIRFQQQARHR